MKFSFSGASLVAFCLLSACASTNTPASNNDANNGKVATSDCEVVGPSIGSKLSHRSCAPAAPAASTAPATQPDSKQPSSTQ